MNIVIFLNLCVFFVKHLKLNRS